MSVRRKFNIVCRLHNAGLGRDISVLEDFFKDKPVRLYVNGYPHYITRSTLLHRRLRRRLERQVWRWSSPPAFDVNLFLEDIDPDWIDRAPVNYLIPNPEWVRDTTLPFLDRMDFVLCKTVHACQIFEGRGFPAEYISFTGTDRFHSEHITPSEGVLHMAGSSLQKGTGTLVNAWVRHPEWPLLTVVQTFGMEIPGTIHNIKHISRYISDEQLVHLLNSHRLHVCPSEAEGFGHALVESLSCEAVTITTDAPPMNEVVTTDRGILVEVAGSEPQRWGMNYFVDEADLEDKVGRALEMPETECNRLGAAARAWYLENDIFFRDRLNRVLFS